MTKWELRALTVTNYLIGLSVEATGCFILLVLLGNTSKLALTGSYISAYVCIFLSVLAYLIKRPARRRALGKLPTSVSSEGKLAYTFCIHVSSGEKKVHETIVCEPAQLPHEVEETIKKLDKPKQGKKYKVRYAKCKRCKFATCDDPRNGKKPK